jgi:hypothetical protein
MAKNPTLPNPAATAFQPPRTLGDPGLSLWNRIMSEYRIEDCGGLENVGSGMPSPRPSGNTSKRN